MKNSCWLCGGTRNHQDYDNVMYSVYVNSELVSFGKTCLDEILTQHVLDFESKDKVMSERMNRHEAEHTEESITISNDKGI